MLKLKFSGDTAVFTWEEGKEGPTVNNKNFYFKLLLLTNILQREAHPLIFYQRRSFYNKIYASIFSMSEEKALLELHKTASRTVIDH